MIQIEAGKYYETVHGKVFGPMIENLSKLYDEEWKWTAKNANGIVAPYWRSNGTFGVRTHFDLVKEVPAPESN